MFQIVPAAVADGPDIDILLDTCFGPARFARTAYRLRDGVEAIPELSLVARDGDTLAGSIQMWPMQLRSASGTITGLTLLGPLVVSPARRCEGVGSRLMEAALAKANAIGANPIVLIGDAVYYERFGFGSAATRDWIVPGPVDRDRLLLRGAAALPRFGWLESARSRRRLAA